MAKTVCIIGAGIAGLIAAKTFAEDQDKFQITVYERSHEIAGVWSASRAYAGLCTNNAKYTFGICGEPIPDHFDEYPTAKQMLEYFNNYADKYKLKKFIRFNTEVIKAKEVQDGAEKKWEVTTRQGEKQTTTSFDFLIVATGLYDRPFVPQFENASSFQGKSYHAGEILDNSAIKNKRVLIIGSGKSAGDMMHMCGEFAKDTLMIFRKAHWLIPRFLSPAKVSTRFALYGKWYRYILPYYNLCLTDRIVQTIMGGFRRGFWGFVRNATIMDMMVAKDSPLIPEHPIIVDPSLGIAPKDYYENLKAGKTRAEKTEVVRFVPNSKMVEFKNGKTEEFDVVIYATGYIQGFPFFDSETTQKLQIPSYSQSGRVFDSPFRLYRSIIPISGPSNIGFVGFVNAISNAIIHEMQAHWLTEYFLKNLAVPSEAEREKDVAKYLEFQKEYLSLCGGVGHSLLPFSIHMYDTLLQDLRLPQTRTGNFFAEYFAPTYPTRFRQMQQEKLAVRAGKVRSTTQSFYFSFLHFLFIIVVAYFLYSLLR